MSRRTSLVFWEFSSLPRGRFFAPVLLSLALFAGVCASVRAQTSSGPKPQPVTDSSALPDAPVPQTTGPGPSSSGGDAVTLRNVPADILKEQGAIWTSPIRIRERNLPFLVPFGLATTVAIASDHAVMSSARLDNTSLNNEAATASNGLLGGFVAAPVLIYGLGHIHHDDHATETGILAGEAMVDSLIVDEAMKAVSMRERPTVDDAKGKFFQSGVGLGSSFPSTHSIVAWSSAAVIASEYPGPMTKITAYGLATGLSLTRVLARQHFPSDVLVGSAFGWMLGRYVAHKRHKEDIAY
jgi:membrane-associated phospholipid phosphatase